MPESTDMIYIAISTIVLVTFMSLFVLLFVFRYRDKQIQHARELEMQRTQQQFEFAKAQLEISEDIMKKISLEIHDNVGQSLSLAKLSVQSINPENLSNQVSNTTEILTRAIGDLRHLSKSLNGNFIKENGLIASVEREAKAINATGKIKCQIIDETNEKTIGDHREVILFRCIQEAINNCIKHANATELTISFIAGAENLTAQVKDNGRGIAEEMLASYRDGLGMSGMKNRMNSISGNFNLESSVGVGTMITFSAPYIR